jgi:hypothetical protein
MRKLPLHYRTLLEAEDPEKPTVTNDDNSLQFHNPPGWDRRLRASPYPHHPDRPPTEGSWPGWGEYEDPYWPRLPSGVKWPKDPPTGWPSGVEYPPPPGHPVYEAIKDWYKEWKRKYGSEYDGDLLNLPPSVRQKVFAEFIRRYPHYNQSTEAMGMQLLTALLLGWTGIGGLYNINSVVGRVGLSVDAADVVQNIGDRVNNGPPMQQQNPWGGYWPEGPGQPPPHGWYLNPETGEWEQTYPMVMPPNWKERYHIHWDIEKGGYYLVPKDGSGLWLWWNPYHPGGGRWLPMIM